MKDIIKFEIKKIFRQRLIALSVIILLLLNVTNIIINNHDYLWGRNVSYNEVKLEVYDEVKGVLTREKISPLAEKYNELSYLISANLKIPEKYTKQGCTYFELQQIYMYHMGEIEKIYSFNKESSVLREKNEDNLKRALRAGNNYLLRQGEKISDIYSDRKIVVYYDTERFTPYLEYSFSSFLIILLTLLGVSSIFSGEYETGMNRLHNSTKNGKIRLSLAKVTALSVYIALISCAFFVTDFLVFKFSVRLEGLSAPIFSIEEFRLCPVSLSVGIFILLTSVFKIIGFIYIGVLISLISCIFKKSYFVFAFGFVSTIAFMLLSAYIGGDTAYINLINPLSLVTAASLFKSFNVINILNFPVMKFSFTLFLCILVIAVLIALIAYMNRRKRKWS